MARLGSICLLLSAFLMILAVGCKSKSKETMTIALDETGLHLSFDDTLVMQRIKPLGKISGMPRPDVDGYTYRFLVDSVNEVSISAYINDQTVSLYYTAPGTSDFLKNPPGIRFGALPGIKNGMAAYKYGPVKAWTTPRPFQRIEDFPGEDVQFALWQYQDSLYAAAVPMGGRGFIASLGATNEEILVKATSKTSEVENPSLIPLLTLSFHENPFQAVANAYQEAFTLMGLASGLRTQKQFPPLFEYLGWCSWNAFGKQVSQNDILRTAAQFSEKEIPLGWMLIDDGWQDVSSDQQLNSFAAQPYKFPQGLNGLKTLLKEEYNVQHLGVWHTLNGYWKGINPDGPLGNSYAGLLYAYMDRVTWSDDPIDTFYIPNPTRPEGSRFYKDWYAHLDSQGIDLIKVDNQLIVDRMAGPEAPLWQVAAQAQENFQHPAREFFSAQVINCMDMSNYSVYHFGSSAVGRCVEDYFPENQSFQMTHGNAAVHVLNAAHNALWFSQMAWPDYDMFQSHHPQSELHAVARALSGGPVYITDRADKTEPEILWKLINARGKIYRCDQPGLPTRDCLFQLGEARVFKMYSKAAGIGIIGAFNLADADRVSGYIQPTDVEGLVGTRFILYDRRTDGIEEVLAGDRIPVTLQRSEAKLYYVVPRRYDMEPLGTVTKYIAPKTFRTLQQSDNQLVLEIHEPGPFIFFADAAQLQVRFKDQVLPDSLLSYSNGLGRIQLSKDNPAFSFPLRLTIDK